MKRIGSIVFSALLLFAATTAEAQRAERLGVSPRSSATPTHLTTSNAALPGNSGMPSWVRWGLVGAIGGAALFVLADGLNSGSHSTGSGILAGAATGFVVVGGGVLLYDSVCSGSARSGFCGR